MLEARMKVGRHVDDSPAQPPTLSARTHIIHVANAHRNFASQAENRTLLSRRGGSPLAEGPVEEHTPFGRRRGAAR